MNSKKAFKLAEIALKEAEKSKHRYKLGAIIFKQGKIISKGYNQTNRYNRFNYGHWEGSLHAELAALLGALKRARGASLMVVRKGYRMAYPCPDCMAALKDAGIKRVFYTTNNFTIDMERI